MNEFNYNSIRAKKARAGRILNAPLMRALLVFVIVFGICGSLYLLFFEKNAVGWLCLIPSIVSLQIMLWSWSDLKRVPLGKSDNINDILSSNVLKVLDRDPKPEEFIESLYKTWSGKFLAVRFGITKDFLEEVAKEIPSDMTPVFAFAREIREKINAEVVSGGMIGVAILKQHPDYEKLLRERKLDMDDLIDGLNWHNHLYGLVRNSGKRHHDGGIARDFSFGWTPTLSKYSVNISERMGYGARTQICLESRRVVVEKMIEAFSKDGRQNVALIGPDGVGRSRIVAAFADTLMDADAKVPAKLRYRQVVALEASALIAAGGERGELEALMKLIFNEAYAAKNIIICLDNAELFFEEGVGSVDISNILLPIIESGSLRIIMKMDEQKYLKIAAKNSALANQLNKIMVEAADEEGTMRVMQDEILALEAKYGVVYQYLALKEAYRLAKRYIHDLEMPGRALSLLESSANYAFSGLVTAESVMVAIEKTNGVKLSSANDEKDRTKLLNLEELIRKRMVGQDYAVRNVSDAMRRAAVGVRNQNKPIGTFLFLGPTGVGKTELSKTLAEVYFNGEDNLIRLDMNEFVSEDDVKRLIEEGKDNSESLTAQVMTHPFSVVLLDEIEKAHPAVLTALLQMLDEGVLRDAKNREVSFRDAIVIATSNAGADLIRRYVDEKKDLSEAKEEIINELIEKGEFRPEFVNRFDEICVFVPLTIEELTEIVNLNLKSINKTMEPRKIKIELGPGVAEELAKRGYDPKMGARPLKRVMQKTIENIVAREMLTGNAEDGATIVVTKEML